jgi:hypothetical protein
MAGEGHGVKRPDEGEVPWSATLRRREDDLRLAATERRPSTWSWLEYAKQLQQGNLLELSREELAPVNYRAAVRRR